MVRDTVCSEMASGDQLVGTCCDGLKSGEPILYINATFYSCNDYVKLPNKPKEYVANACPNTCGGKVYQFYYQIYYVVPIYFI